MSVSIFRSIKTKLQFKFDDVFLPIEISDEYLEASTPETNIKYQFINLEVTPGPANFQNCRVIEMSFHKFPFA